MPPPPPWSDLPLELAGLVLGRLPAHADRIRSAAACRQWRAAVREVPLPPPMPLLVILDGTAYSFPLHTPLRFPACAGYSAAAAAASGNWLLFVSLGTGDGGRCFLKDPFSGATLGMPGDRVVFFEKDDEDRGWFGRESTSSCIVYDMRDRDELDGTLLPKAFRWKRGTVSVAWLFPEDSSKCRAT